MRLWHKKYHHWGETSKYIDHNGQQTLEKGLTSIFFILQKEGCDFKGREGVYEIRTLVIKGL